MALLECFQVTICMSTLESVNSCDNAEENFDFQIFQMFYTVLFELTMVGLVKLCL